MSNASPTAVFVHEGKCLDHTPVSAVAAGDIVIAGGILGVVKSPIDANDTGAICVQGVVSVPKGAFGTTIGQKLYWDASAEAVVATPAADDYLLGFATTAQASGDARVNVLINPSTNGIHSVYSVLPGVVVMCGTSAVTGTLAVAAASTGLTSIISAVGGLAENAAINGDTVTMDKATPGSGGFTIKVWMPTSVSNPTPIASNAAKNVDWIVIGRN
jgi:predicted RecA/RadA family phage recombinase